MRTDYNITIRETMHELSAKERVRLKMSISNAIKLDEVVQPDGTFVIDTIDNYAVLDVHNEHSENTDYMVLLIVSGDTTYTTGSESFANAFIDVVSEMQSESEDWGIECFKIPSRNYKNKFILSCTVC